jgi:hypothetical protein
MERNIVEYSHAKWEQSKMEEIWVRWLGNKGDLHRDTIMEIKNQWKSGECSLVLEKFPTLFPSQIWVDAYIPELEVQVGFNAKKGSPASLEINEIKLGELVLPQAVFDEVMNQCKEEIEEVCWDELKAQEEENAIAAAEHHLDFREDRS